MNGIEAKRIQCEDTAYEDGEQCTLRASVKAHEEYLCMVHSAKLTCPCHSNDFQVPVNQVA